MEVRSWKLEVIFSFEEIDKVADKILSQNPKKIILFNGNMGAGKTTLINALCKKLGVTSATSSPTYSLVNEYQTTDNQLVYHFDFYRLKHESEALDMGADDYFYSDNWCFIEWSERIPNLIPLEHSILEINVLEDGKRQLILK